MKKIIAHLLTAVTALSLAACGSPSNVVKPDKDGFAEGELGSTMRTYFFDYTVNSAYLCDTYEGYEAAEDYELLVANITVLNTGKSEVEMYDSDFQIQWGDNSSDDAFEFSLTFYTEDGQGLSAEMLPGTYTLASKESRTGVLVAEVPAGHTEFSISYRELFDDDSAGDTFFVYFDATKNN